MDIRTESRNVTMVPQWQEEIEGRLHDLQDGHNDILHARMILERNRHHNKGPKVAMARLVCNVRGGTFTASKTEETFEEAIRATFNAMEEELRTFREKRKQRARVAYHVRRVLSVPDGQRACLQELPDPGHRRGRFLRRVRTAS